MSYQMNGWHYSRPNTNRNKDGNIVLIKAVSFGRQKSMNGASMPPVSRIDLMIG